jgi:glyoxylase-like metal-dependent hydrolase (beta-lactamase superfamily II)/8-oxo-dGTP pyrophosphatase MutT (NUDIX family)
MTRQQPRPASTLVLLRDAAQGPELFMVERSHAADFVAGAYVFPGGAVDDADAHPDLQARVQGLSDHAASRRLGVASNGIGYWVAAVRECFEEAGILLAVDAGGAPIAPERMLALTAYRDQLNAGEIGFLEFLEREDLYLPCDRIAYFAHWITPPARSRRYSTRFFVALAPAGQVGSHDAGETVSHTWIRPADALARFEQGTLTLVNATRDALARLGGYAEARAALEAAFALDEIVEHRACWATGRDGKRLFRRNDPAYFEIHWCDPEESGESTYEMLPGIPKRLDRLVTRVIAPNPGMMTGPGTNTYLVGDRELAVIDPGPDDAAHLEAVLAAGEGRIRWILCTHTHIDHSPAAAALRAATGAEVIGRPAPPGESQDAGFAPARVPAHGERLALDGLCLRVLHTPGHASNHLCYLLEETRMLFTGDHVMQGSTVVIGPPDGSMQAYLNSLEALLAEDVAVFAPGHGYLIGEPHKEVRRLIAHRLAREAKVAAALARLGISTLDVLVAAVYDDVHPRLHRVAARSLRAHLDKLVAEGRVRDETGHYRLVATAS